MDFVFDPPLELPAVGTYAFWLQRAGCDIGESTILSVFSDVSDAYPGGTYWFTRRTAGLPCFLRAADEFRNIDLIFEIEFCTSEGPTPAQSRSWGSLKVIYR